MNKSILTVTQWNEEALTNFTAENSITKASVEYTVTGHLEGVFKSEYVIHYSNYDINNLADAQSTFSGFTIFKGSIGSVPTTVVFEEQGVHDHGLKSDFTVKSSTHPLDGSQGYYLLEGNEVVFRSDY